MARTKLIGLTTYQFEIPWGPTKKLVSATPSTYYDLVARAGGRPLLLPAVRSDNPGLGAEEVVEALDGLVVIGGFDVDPSLYGAEPHAHLGTTDLARDLSELAVLQAALAADLPILAICRGHQLLNVALGGTLHQHVPELLGHSDHQLGFGTYSSREVRLDPDSRTAAVFGASPTVSCSHHQVVDQLGEGLVAVGWSIEEDGTEPVIEAMERTTGRFCLSVQWHPEDRHDLRPFEALMDA